MLQIVIMSNTCEIALRWMSQNTFGSSNGLLPSGNKPLREQMLTWIYVTILCHQVKISSWLRVFTPHDRVLVEHPAVDLAKNAGKVIVTRETQLVGLTVTDKNKANKPVSHAWK